MLSEEQKSKIEQLSQKYEPLLRNFPTWDSTKSHVILFPDTNDLRAIAEKVEPFNFGIHGNHNPKSVKHFAKLFFIRFIQPLSKILFKRQMLFNEYMWLLANTVAAQNQMIRDLEKRLNELEAQNSH